jgi:aspartyl aminopeptidase
VINYSVTPSSPPSHSRQYFFSRDMSSIAAFAVGEKYQPGNGFKIIGAHTDSPNLRVKPNFFKTSVDGLSQVNVSCYGSGLWHTWFDRDLSVSGRVMVRVGSKIITQLVMIPHPILRIPNLSIHLTPPEEREAFKPNKETHLAPILCETTQRTLPDQPGLLIFPSSLPASPRHRISSSAS